VYAAVNYLSDLIVKQRSMVQQLLKVMFASCDSCIFNVFVGFFIQGPMVVMVIIIDGSF